MPDPRRDYDAMIREALQEAEEPTIDDAEADTAVGLLTEAFRGRNRRLAIGGAVGNLVMFVVALFCGVRFVGAGEARETAAWGIAMLLAFGLVIAIKIWYWLEMNRLALTREIKRVELRVARMADTIERLQPQGDSTTGAQPATEPGQTEGG